MEHPARHRVPPRLATVWLVLAVCFSAPRAARAMESLVRVPLGAGITAQRLVDAGLDVVSVRGDACLLLVTPEDEGTLRALGATSVMLDPAPGLTAARRARAELASRPETGGRVVRSAARPDGIVRDEVLPPFGSGSLGGYWTNAEVKMKLDDLVASDAAGLVADKIDTIGTTIRKRPIYALTLGKPWTGIGSDPRPVVYLSALTHAREPGGMQTLFYWVDNLLARYPSDPMARELLEQRRIVICPVVNPDGYAINESLYVALGMFAMWRKNARDNDNNGVYTSNDGVDINRNYGFAWGLSSGSSASFSAQDYHGPGAFSEPETRAQRDEVVAIQPATGLSFHTFGDWHLHAWGYTAAATADSAWWYRWDDDATRDNAYQSGQSTRVLYAVSGEFNDWVYGDTLLKPRGYTWTPEIGDDDDGFWPPPSRMAPLALENLWRCDYTAALAGPFVQIESIAGLFSKLMITVTNVGLRDTGLPVHATLTPLSSGVTVLQAGIDLPAVPARTTRTGPDAFTVALDDTVTPGRLISFQVEFTTADGHVSRDKIQFPCGTPTRVFFDDATTGLGKWLTSGWGTETSVDPLDPGPYFADSPGGIYPNNMNRTLRTLNPVALSGSWVHAYLGFRAKWDFETKYDGALIGQSVDGVNFTALASTGTRPAKGQSGSVLPTAGVPALIGTRHLWRTDRADLSPYSGMGALSRYLRFQSMSDPGTTFDGLDVDDIEVDVYDPAAQPQPTAVTLDPAPELALAAPSPNPARGRASFRFALPRASHAKLEVFDPAGRRVVTLADGGFAAGRWVRGWDLADAAGHRVGPGLYLVRLATPDGVRVQRVVVLW
jgi:carboxypeptidase T